MGGGGGASSILKRAARKMVLVAACGSFSCGQSVVDPSAIDASAFSISGSSSLSPRKREPISEFSNEAELTVTTTNNKSICAICLDPLSYSTAMSPNRAIFTAQCSHSFHFTCISSNVCHGNITCPICRAHWTQLPRNLNLPCSIPCNPNDPILRILDDSIANFRVHRRSFLRSARYDDDDPIEPDQIAIHPRLQLSLLPIPPAVPTFHNMTSYHPPGPGGAGVPTLAHLMSPTPPDHSTLNGQIPYMCASSSACLSVKLAHQLATDLVLLASPNGPHLRLLKQAMALVVFSLRPIDRLAIVTHSSSAARIFPLRRMTSNGKRTALQVIDRVFYMGQADPMEGLRKGIKILEDRAHKNPESCILHLFDSPTRPYHPADTQVPAPIHRFHVGFSLGTSNGFVMHEFEEFLASLLGGVAREIQVRIGEEGRIMRLGELRGGEEKKVLLDLGDREHVRVGFSYVEGGVGEFIRTGEVVVSLGDKRERSGNGEEPAGRDVRDGSVVGGGRRSSDERWDYHDPYMARRWAKHLHGYRL